jgi:hypothetical protein
VSRTFFQRVLENLFEDDDSSDARVTALPPVVQAWLSAARFPAGQMLVMLPWSLEFR